MSPENCGGEGQNGEHKASDVFSSLSSGCHFRRRRQCGELGNASAHASKDHAANEDVHCVRRGADDHAEHDKGRAGDGDVAPAHEVGEGADEGTDGGEGEEVAQHEPDPAVCAAYVGVDDGGDAAEEVDGDLRAGPY